MLLTRKSRSSCRPFQMRPRRRVALRRALGWSLLATGTLGIAQTALCDRQMTTISHIALSSAMLILYSYIALAMMGSRLARPDIAAGNAALTLLFPTLHTFASGSGMQDATATVFFCYYSMQIGVYIATFIIESRRRNSPAGLLYARRIFIPAVILGILAAAEWAIPSATAAVTLMIATTLYSLYLTIIFLRHSFFRRHIS